jgi:hypothetical protein
MRMRYIVTSFVATLVPPYFLTLSHKEHNFREKCIEHKNSVSIFSTTFVQNTSHSEKNLARYCQKKKTPHWCFHLIVVRGFE